MPKKSTGPEFSKLTKRELAEEAGFICSNPDCHEGTALGPTDFGARSKVGDAAHICGARLRTARYDPDQTDEERATKENGIFLCVECHDKIDADEQKYPAELLHEWKRRHAQYLSAGLDTEERKAGRLVLANLDEVLPMWHRESEARSRSLFSPFRLHPDTTKQLMESISIPENLEFALRQATEAEIDSKKRVLLLTGDAGSGKSTYLGSIFRRAIKQFESVSTSRVPIMIQGLREHETLEHAIRERATLLGITHLKAALIFVDKLDELEPRTLRTALSEAEALTHSGDMIFLFATRPVLDAELPATTVPVSPLSMEDVLRIASYSAQREVDEYEYSHQSTATKEFLKRPLFALLFGFWLKHAPEHGNTSGTRLLAFLIEQVFGEFEGNRHDDASDLLQKLAIESTNRGGEAVPIREVCPMEKRDLLTRTGLVTLDGGNLSFALPLLTQWYAADALLEEAISLEDVLESRRLSEFWKYAIVFALIRSGGNERRSLLSRLIGHSPALGSECILRAASGFDMTPHRVVSWRREAEDLVYGLSIWSESIQPLNRHLEPIRDDGSIPPLVFIPHEREIDSSDDSQGSMVYYWDITSSRPNLVIEDDGTRLREDRGHAPRTIHIIGTDMLPDFWAWSQTLSSLQSALKDLLKERWFSISSDTDLELEELWRHARRFVNRSWSHLTPVTREEINAKISQHKRWKPDYKPSRRIHWTGEKSLIYEEWFLGRFDELDRDFGDPWGDRMATREAAMSWQEYSMEEILPRVERIFSSALRSYKKLVEQIFPKFSSRLLRYSELPVHLHVTIDQRTLTQREIGISYYSIPLSTQSDSIVSVSIDEDESDWTYEAWSAKLQEQAQEYQKGILARENFYWNGIFSRHGFSLKTDNTTPVSDLVYSWLEEDLISVGWLSGKLKDEGFGTG